MTGRFGKYGDFKRKANLRRNAAMTRRKASPGKTKKSRRRK